MVTLTVEENGGPVAPMGHGIAAVRELGLRVISAGLQILATVAVVQVLAPPVAGIYFRGVLIAYGLAALLRGKYELFAAQYFANPHNCHQCDHARAIVRGLGIRVLVRSAIACAVLLVFTTDLDVMDVYLRPYLQTYLPFVLAVPFASLALFLASTLRAANHTLGSVMVSSYSINIMIFAAATLSVTVWPEAPLVALSWGFFIGCVLAAGVGALLTRHLFHVRRRSRPMELAPAEWRDIYATTGGNGLTGVALAVLQWGPLCVLAVFGTGVEIAQFAVVTRTAQIIDFLIPAVIFVPHSARIQSRLCQAMHSQRGKLAVDFSVSVATTSICVLAVGILTPWLVSLYGAAYSGLSLLFLLLYLTQWVGGALRPGLRQLAADWDMRRIRRIMIISMTVAVALSLMGVNRYGPYAAAVGGLAGALVLNGAALGRALKTQAHPDRNVV